MNGSVESDARPSSWSVYFDLPFVVSVADSMDDPSLRRYLEAVASGESPNPVPYSPRLRPGFGFSVGGAPVYLPDPASLAEPFVVPVAGSAAQIRFLRRLRNVDRAIVTVGEFRPDRGNGAYSSTQVVLSSQLSRSLGRNDLQGAAELSVEALNRFLEIYRYMCGAYWAQPISVSDGSEFIIVTVLDTGERVQPRVYSSSGQGPLIGLGSKPLLDHRDQKFREELLTARMPFAFELKLSAQEHIHRGRFRNAIVDAATAVEVFVSELLRRGLQQRGRTKSAIEGVFTGGRGLPRSVTSLAKSALRSELGIDFGATSEYSNWQKHVVHPRNAVVHGSRLSITRGEAVDSVAHSQAAVTRLRALAADAGVLNLTPE